jgi:hypothetical protein
MDKSAPPPPIAGAAARAAGGKAFGEAVAHVPEDPLGSVENPDEGARSSPRADKDLSEITVARKADSLQDAQATVREPDEHGGLDLIGGRDQSEITMAKKRARKIPRAKLTKALLDLAARDVDIANMARGQLHGLTLKEAAITEGQQGSSFPTFERALREACSLI